MNEEDDKFIDFVIEGIVTIVIAILGLIGNTFIIVTLSRPQMRSSVNFLFLALACFDTLFLVCVLLLIGIPSLSLRVESLTKYDKQVVPKIALVIEPIGFISQTASTWTTVVITVERYIAVCHPLKARDLCSYGKVRLCLIFVVIFSVCFNIPEFVFTAQMGGVEKIDNANGTNEKEDEIFSEVYNMWLYLVVMYVLPFVAFVVLNMLIFRTIRIARKTRRALVKSVEKELNLVTMLICVVTIYFTCNVTRIIHLLMDRFMSCCVIVDDVSTAFLILNCSVNFVIYYVICERFRNMFLKLFCGWRRSTSKMERDVSDNVHECQKLTVLTADK